MTIGGNFESDYESVSFKTFNPTSIINKPFGRSFTFILRSKFGVIRLTTPIMKLAKITITDAGVELQTISTDDFSAFCRDLEGPIFRMYRVNNVTKHIVDQHQIKFIMPRYKLDMQTATGKSCLRSQRGDIFNIEEDLYVGDDIQILFVIEMKTTADERFIELKPLRFIKYKKYEVSEEPSSDEEPLLAPDNFDGVIRYPAEIGISPPEEKQAKK
jgi:hypothetical protein